MKKITYLTIFAVLLLTACDKDESVTPENGVPVVKSASSYNVLKDEDITYANGLSHNANSTAPFSISLKLDLYYPDNNDTNRPVYMFIHGGGFQGGTKEKPEIQDMAQYFASRGWVFASIDYRTTEELGNISGMTQEQVLAFYKGLAPEEWINFSIENASSPSDVSTSVAMYMAQRDAKAALRWLVANANTYNINPDFITVGGASAGAVSTVALGISDQDDFRDEISVTDDATLSTTNLNENYTVKSMVYFWGSNVKLELFGSIYNVDPYDSNDPEIFLAHGTNDQNPTTTYSEATELNSIYNSLGVYNELVPLEGAGHGAWGATVNGKSLSDLSFDFLTQRQGLNVE